MMTEQQLLFLNKMNWQTNSLTLNKNYKIINTEHEFIVHPAALGILPMTAEALQRSFACSYLMKDYCMFLDKLIIYNESIAEPCKESEDSKSVAYAFMDQHIAYSGTILIGDLLLKDYSLKGCKTAYFSYESVFELVFDDGNLITTIDHSKSMLRIRKNIDLKLRSLSNKRDVRCIARFMNSSFIGEYKPYPTYKKRLHYLEEMKKSYQNKTVSFTIEN